MLWLGVWIVRVRSFEVERVEYDAAPDANEAEDS
jgi:hypothetical protein